MDNEIEVSFRLPVFDVRPGPVSRPFDGIMCYQTMMSYVPVAPMRLTVDGVTNLGIQYSRVDVDKPDRATVRLSHRTSFNKEWVIRHLQRADNHWRFEPAGFVTKDNQAAMDKFRDLSKDEEEGTYVLAIDSDREKYVIRRGTFDIAVASGMQLREIKDAELAEKASAPYVAITELLDSGFLVSTTKNKNGVTARFHRTHLSAVTAANMTELEETLNSGQYAWAIKQYLRVAKRKA